MQAIPHHRKEFPRPRWESTTWPGSMQFLVKEFQVIQQFVTFSSPNVGGHKLSERSLNHPKKVTKNCQVGFFSFCFLAGSFGFMDTFVFFVLAAPNVITCAPPKKKNTHTNTHCFFFFLGGVPPSKNTFFFLFFWPTKMPEVLDFFSIFFGGFVCKGKVPSGRGQAGEG